MDDELLTIFQVATYLQLSDKTVRRLIKDHQLAASKIGDRSWRIKASDVENYLDAHSNVRNGAKSE